MKVSQLFGRTSKTDGESYKIDSHRLLTKAGFIRESTAGRYYLLPLGLRVHDKIIDIVRKHMDNAGAQEVAMPTLHPLELWKETNRTSTTGFELMTVEDRRGAEFALGGTAEEMAVDLVRQFNVSYKDLPFNIYQFSTKFRDEMRARGGLLRVREFVMKDAYSFSTEEQFAEVYQGMWDAYVNIFEGMGLSVDVVESDNGYIGGDYCHEYVVRSEIGESRYFTTDSGSYAAHEDVAKFKRYDEGATGEAMKDREDVEGKGIIGVAELAEFLGIPVEKTTKTILFEDENGNVIAAAVNGIYDINEMKLKHVVGCHDLKLASEETVKRVTGAEVGFAGILNLPPEVTVVMDTSLEGRVNFEMGANQTDYHSINVNFGRDLPLPDQFHDIALAQPGYEAPNGETLIEHRGIEVGNIFQLGYHYTKLMTGAEYADSTGQPTPYYMGCYGIGIGRTLAAAVEVFHDDRGIIWPEAIAPYKVYLISLGSDEDVRDAANALYKELQDANVEVLFDDRDARAGEKFSDADLIGIPYRVLVSSKTLAQNAVEWKGRTATDSEMVPLGEVVSRLTTT